MTIIESTPAPIPQKKSRRGLWLSILFLGALIVAAALWALPQVQALRTNSSPGVHVGQVAPEIKVRQLENGKPGATVSLSSLRGKPVVVNFWATWCVPCRAEFPALDSAYRQFKDSKQLAVIGVNTQGEDSGADAQQFLGEVGATFPIWMTNDTSVEDSYRLAALPMTVFIDRDGIVRDVVIGGPMTSDFIQQELQKIF